ncbi:hypothetical protein GMORB2_0459 [Geosmithia morbida]|uniref:CCHC-type domain-containing protein n=1 Tax=Geosmithia morbida TaxID=1094350 RepID=A0A9P5D521_9HYPO|nr:uncharacterized protein GMORB2_0459 [Geosmithia morbida]KAF4126722.1 hypothetical protein GMORB2_0459 [Geosmithia morbida]
MDSKGIVLETVNSVVGLSGVRDVPDLGQLRQDTLDKKIEACRKQLTDRLAASIYTLWLQDQIVRPKKAGHSTERYCYVLASFGLPLWRVCFIWSDCSEYTLGEERDEREAARIEDGLAEVTEQIKAYFEVPAVPKADDKVADTARPTTTLPSRPVSRTRSKRPSKRARRSRLANRPKSASKPSGTPSDRHYRAANALLSYENLIDLVASERLRPERLSFDNSGHFLESAVADDLEPVDNDDDHGPSPKRDTREDEDLQDRGTHRRPSEDHPQGVAISLPRLYSCDRCHQGGHNTRDCPSGWDLPMYEAPGWWYRCGMCGMESHRFTQGCPGVDYGRLTTTETFSTPSDGHGDLQEESRAFLARNPQGWPSTDGDLEIDHEADTLPRRRSARKRRGSAPERTSKKQKTKHSEEQPRGLSYVSRESVAGFPMFPDDGFDMWKHEDGGPLDEGQDPPNLQMRRAGVVASLDVDSLLLEIDNEMTTAVPAQQNVRARSRLSTHPLEVGPPPKCRERLDNETPVISAEPTSALSSRGGQESDAKEVWGKQFTDALSVEDPYICPPPHEPLENIELLVTEKSLHGERPYHPHVLSLFGGKVNAWVKKARRLRAIDFWEFTSENTSEDIGSELPGAEVDGYESVGDCVDVQVKAKDTSLMEMIELFDVPGVAAA